jgi:hypothetical protein
VQGVQLRWVLGYPYALVLMLAAVAGAVIFFRWRDWI